VKHGNIVFIEAYRFCGKSEGKGLLGRLECRWEENIKIGFREVGWVGVDWIELDLKKYKWRAVVNMMLNVRVQ
jgi:hypothetical protein